MTSDLAGDRLAERDHTTFRSGIDGFEHRAHTSRIRADVHDSPEPGVDHRWQAGVGRSKNALVVEVDDVIPELFVGLDKRFQFVPSGTVHEHFDRAELVDDSGEASGDRVGPGDVHLHRKRPTAIRGDRVDRRCSLGGP